MWRLSINVANNLFTDVVRQYGRAGDARCHVGHTHTRHMCFYSPFLSLAPAGLIIATPSVIYMIVVEIHTQQEAKTLKEIYLI